MIRTIHRNNHTLLGSVFKAAVGMLPPPGCLLCTVCILLCVQHVIEKC